ncbi:MAG: S8 family serine peptidase, partial [Halothiobacillaceae bacterium]
QSLAELGDKGFVRDDATGTCTLERNHAALATTGIDKVRMMGYTGKNVPIAIVDTGYLPDHTEYVANILSVASYDDKNYNNELDAGEKIVGDYTTNNNAHGTTVAGQAVGYKAGVAPGAGVHAKSLNLFAGGIAIAIKDSIFGDAAPVINLSNSLGTDVLMYQNKNTDNTGILAATAPTSVVMVLASGNEGTDLSDAFDDAKSVDPSIDSFFDHPDEADNILFVGAFDQEKNELALYSNYPGYRKSFQDRFIVTGDYLFETASHNGPAEFGWGSGTSLAAPQVSGAIAILMEVNPRLTAVQAAQILLDTAQRRPEWGYGQTCTVTTKLGTFSSDCGAMKFGRGLMDLPKAVEVARGA